VDLRQPLRVRAADRHVPRPAERAPRLARDPEGVSPMADGNLGGGGMTGAPEPPDARDRPRVGVDEWVASHEQRREAGTGVTGFVRRTWERLPPFARLAILVGPFVVFPFVTNEGNLFRYGPITVVYALLALGLHVVVG